MSELPKGWMISSLKDVLMSLESGSRPKGGVRNIKEGIPSIGGEHLTYRGKFDFSSVKFVPKSFADKMTKGHIQSGDILIVKDGATTGKTVFVDETFPYKYAVVNEHVFICRPTSLIESRFLFFYLFSEEGQQSILANFQGSAQGGINLSFAPNTQVVLAPLNEQRRIVEKLEKILERVEACRERLEKIPLILKRFRQSVLAAACDGRLTADWRERNLTSQTGKYLISSIKTRNPEPHLDIFEKSSQQELPDTWTWVQLGKLGLFLGGGTPSTKNSNYWNGNIPWITPKDMKKDRIKDSEDHITKEALVNSSAKIIPKGSILFVVRGMILNHTLPTAVTDVELTLNQDLKALVPEIKEMSEYICLMAKHIAKAILFEVKEATHGTRRIETPVLKNWAAPVPPLSEQQEIVRRVESLFKLADQIEARYQKAKAQVDKLTQSILAKAFRGELVPQDPNDEPASLLLERIQQEKSENTKPLSHKQVKSSKETKSLNRKASANKAFRSEEKKEPEHLQVEKSDPIDAQRYLPFMNED